MVKRIVLVFVLIVVVLFGYAAFIIYQDLQKGKSEDPLVWENEIAEFEESLIKRPADEGALLFIGSSSIRFWGSIHQDMQPFDVVQRGFGGAKFLDVVHYADRLIDIGVSPAAIVLFIGTNDIHPGQSKEPALLLKRYQQFIEVVREKHQLVPVYYIAITPTPLRWEVWDIAKETNRLISDYAATQENLFVIDASAKLLNTDGSANADLRRFDGLHLNKEGYAKWTSVIQPRLVNDLLN